MLDPSPGAVLVDGTAGGGGHLRTLLQRVGPTGKVIAIDRDPQAVERLTTQLPGPQVQLFCSSYADLPQILDQLQIRAVDGVLLDLGISSDQLADPTRGFSFQVDGPLDLRFNPRSGEPAWRLIERLSAATAGRSDLHLWRGPGQSADRPRHCAGPSAATDLHVL